MRLAIIGTGYVGLVTGACLADLGHKVTCVDIDNEKVAKLKEGRLPIYEPGLASIVKRCVKASRLDFTTNLATIKGARAVFLALPTPEGENGEADLQYVLKAVGDIAKIITSYTVIITKSTVPVGTAQKLKATIAAHTNVTFDIVSNPEFLKEGLAVKDFMQPDRIVVGVSSPKAQKALKDIYKPLTSKGIPLLVMDEASAEMTKYAANSFLVTKISFINEIANICELVGANIDSVKLGIGSDSRIGNQFLNPGIGYGGSCFPKDMLALESLARNHGYNFGIVRAAKNVNKRQRLLFAQRILDHYKDNLKSKTIAIWGLAFKPDTDDIRQSPAIDIIKLLIKHGAKVRVYDPQAMRNAQNQLGNRVDYANSATAALKGADALVIVTDWQEFVKVKPQAFTKHLQDKVVFDGRNIFKPKTMRDSGLDYKSVGRPTVFVDSSTKLTQPR